ncbi:DUF2125 domain-containing protein [uncultured Tateyamaria sp.]|uniref:DUF2125 domain-containing protein n=1 Tax=uncultured Tateyamaria sp. TaxID=455651 RepID=UPI00262286CE|nr:DUF2125 domain-containing protein [uncultured Tateyamaria sp.]
MRKLLWILALCAVGWCGWWWAASTGLRGSINAWFEDRAAAGWQADLSGIDGGGFPLTLVAGLRDVALADPDAGLAIETDRLDITAPAWWPGDVTVTLSDAPILLASPLGRSTLTMANGVMALNLHPGTALELEALGWTSGPWRLADPLGVQAQADTLTLTMTQTTGAAYAVTARADGFAPGDSTRTALRLPETIPRAFDSLQLNADVTFDRPWDRRALEARRPQPRQIDLHLAEARWGDLNLNIAANLVVDDNGTPEGSVALQAENWPAMLDLAEAAGILPTQLRRQADSILRALARASGNETTLDVDLALRGGAVYLGFIPIAPAPKLVIR